MVIVRCLVSVELIALAMSVFVLCMTAQQSMGAEHIVQPVSNTITTEIEATSSGDTLVSQAGSFIGDASVDKSFYVSATSA